MADIEPGTILTGASGHQYIVGEPIGLAPDPDTPCDAAEWGGHPTWDGRTGRCTCTVCPRCGHHTGNGHQGHYWGYCQATKTVREFHMCCIDPAFGCELERLDG